MVTKEELRSYVILNDTVKELQNNLRELQEKKKTIKATSYSGAPSGSTEADKFAGMMIRVEALEKQYIDAAAESLDKLMKIESAINKLPERERLLMRYRYIDGYSWVNIAAKMNYSWQWTHKIHARALKMLQEDKRGDTKRV